MICISAPKSTHLRTLETQAARQYGGTWRVVADGTAVWEDPIDDKNFIWQLSRVEEPMKQRIEFWIAAGLFLMVILASGYINWSDEQAKRQAVRIEGVRR